MSIDNIEKHKYHMVLMDIHMPVLNGFEATKIIKDKGYDMPIIAITADVTHETRDMIDQIGFSDCVYKPANIKTIVQLIKRIDRKKENGHDFVSNNTNSITKNIKRDAKDDIFKRENVLNMLLAEDNDVNAIIFEKYVMMIEKKLNIKINLKRFNNGKDLIDHYDGLEDTDTLFCIFMDIEMPVMNGYKATKLLCEKNKCIPIIGVTGHDTLKHSELFT